MCKSALFLYNIHCVADYIFDVAVHKQAWESSTHPGSNTYGPVDNNFNDNFVSGSCQHTDNDMNAWWAVDLGEVVAVIGVRIQNRGDAHSKFI